MQLPRQLRVRLSSLLLSFPALLVLSGCGPAQKEESSLREFKASHQTKLTIEETMGTPAPEPPAEIFQLVKYEAPPGKLSAYVSPNPGDGKKHPMIIWRVGGMDNSIDDLYWTEAEPDNDQSASQYRKAGVLMMYPSLRGGNGNPGFIEACYGEVEDVLAAAAHARNLDYVDPERIYLGGHSVGGTLAILVAAMEENPFRAIFAFGPAAHVGVYGPEELPFDSESELELSGRAPMLYLNSIGVDTFVIEGETDGNGDSLELMAGETKNPKLRFWLVPGNHFNILAPLNRVIADQIMKDWSTQAPAFALQKSVIDSALP